MTAPITEADREKAREIYYGLYTNRYGASCYVSEQEDDIAEFAAALAQARADGEAEEREAGAELLGRIAASTDNEDILQAAYAIRARGQTHEQK